MGPIGAPGVSGYEIVSVDSALDSSSSKSLLVEYPLGKNVLGGGASIFASLADPNRDTAPVVLRASSPLQYSHGWFAHGIEIGPYTFSWAITAYAVCAYVTP
jgi:hypothetical protein